MGNYDPSRQVSSEANGSMPPAPPVAPPVPAPPVVSQSVAPVSAVAPPNASLDDPSQLLPTPPLVVQPPSNATAEPFRWPAEQAEPELVEASAQIEVTARRPDEFSQGTEADWVAHSRQLSPALKKSPPWLLSSIIHMLFLIVIGLWVFSEQEDGPVELEVRYAETEGEQLDERSFRLTTESQPEVDEQVLTPDELPPLDEPLATPPQVPIAAFATSSSGKIESPTIGMALNGRTKALKHALLSAYGGDATTEAAVLKGLKWLARNQRHDGSWSLRGPYADGGSSENRVAATAMALLAFQGAGHTHQGPASEPFTRVVRRGWNWLLKQQDKQGCFFSGGLAHHRLYTHAQATIAVCELYGMTRDPKFKQPAEQAVAYAIAAQDPKHGGWRYYPGSQSDTSVTGWFVMALQSARMAYIAVPDEVFERISQFLDSVQAPGSKGSQYLYMPGLHTSPAMTAEGLLCRQYLGWAQDDPRLLVGTEYINQVGMSWEERNAYFWYYAAQVCHHMEGSTWTHWNRVMRQLLPEKQIQRGRERGSWDPDGDEWGSHGGRLYVTCMHLFMLEVYYRHLPIYNYRLQRP